MVLLAGEQTTTSTSGGTGGPVNCVGKLKWDPSVTNAHFIDLVDLLRCHQCKKLNYNVYNLPKCDHIICNECKTLLTSKKCPLCGSSASEIKKDSDFESLVKDIRMLNQQFLKISFAIQQQRSTTTTTTVTSNTTTSTTAATTANTATTGSNARVLSPPRPPRSPIKTSAPAAVVPLESVSTSSLPVSEPKSLPESVPVVKGKPKKRPVDNLKTLKETKSKDTEVEEKRATRSTPSKQPSNKDKESDSESPRRLERNPKSKVTKEVKSRKDQNDGTDKDDKTDTTDKTKKQVPRKSVTFSQDSDSNATPRKSPRTNKGNLMYTRRPDIEPIIPMRRIVDSGKLTQKENDKEKEKALEKKEIEKSRRKEKEKEKLEKEKEKEKERIEKEKLKAGKQKEKEKEREKREEKKKEIELAKEAEKEKQKEKQKEKEKEKAEKEKERKREEKAKKKEIEEEKTEEKEKRKKKDKEKAKNDKEMESEMDTLQSKTNDSNNVAYKGRAKRKLKETDVSVDDDNVFVKPKSKGKRAAPPDTASEPSPMKRQRKTKEIPDESDNQSSGGRSASVRSTASTASSRPNSRVLIASTLLTEDQKKVLESFSKTFNIRTTAEFPHNVTHLVTKADSNLRATRSMKYMRALLAHKWILSFDWITESLKACELVPEEPYELLGTTKQSKVQLGAPKRSRTSKKKLFAGLNFYFDGKFKAPDLPSVSDLTDLVNNGGGTIFNNALKLNSALRKNVRVIIVKDELKEDDKPTGSAKVIDTTDLLNVLTLFKTEDLLSN